MASDELLKLRGRLAVAERLVGPLESGIAVDRDTARALLDRYADVPDLKTGELLVIIQRMHEAIQRLRTLREQILSLKEDLGE